MTDHEIHDLKTDVALIKKDIKQIERVFTRVDTAVDDMAELHKISAVQETILENTERRIVNLEDKLVKHSEDDLAFRRELSQSLDEIKTSAQQERERRHQEVLASIKDMHSSIDEKMSKMEDRVAAIEKWRWWAVGAAAAVIFIITNYSSILALLRV
jgi:septal ring factor EnvC (AmiA/AmiB activator)